MSFEFAFVPLSPLSSDFGTQVNTCSEKNSSAGPVTEKDLPSQVTVDSEDGVSHPAAFTDKEGDPKSSHLAKVIQQAGGWAAGSHRGPNHLLAPRAMLSGLPSLSH